MSEVPLYRGDSVPVREVREGVRRATLTFFFFFIILKPRVEFAKVYEP